MVFSTVKRALEWYYGFYPGAGISYEEKAGSQSKYSAVKTDDLDLYATIGHYIHRLDELKKLILACFFVKRLSDDLAAQKISGHLKRSIQGQQVKYHRYRALRRLNDVFKAVGLVADDRW